MHRLSVLAATFFGAILCAASFSPARAGVLISIDKATQQMTVAVDGEPRWRWPVSTGRRGFDTPAGSFKPFRLEEDHYSKEWDEAPMPYSIFFTDGGHAIHGSYEIRNLGRRASHGCVRLSPKNAAKLFALVKREGVSNVRVVVIDDPNAPVVAKHRTPGEKALREARSPAPAVVRTPAAAIPAPIVPNTYGAEQAYGYAPPQPMPEVTTGSVLEGNP
jgi:hypothetical protein